MKKIVFTFFAVLCMATACSAEPGKQTESAPAAQAQALQSPTLEQLNAQYIYLSGAKEVMTAQAKFAADLVGSYAVQLEQIKAKIDAMQAKQDAPAEAKPDKNKK